MREKKVVNCQLSIVSFKKGLFQLFERIEQDGVVFYQVPAFAETGLVDHGFSSRHGGVSEGAFTSLNLGLHTGDCVEDVQQNRKIFAQTFGLRAEQMVYGNQVHGNHVAIVKKEDMGKGALVYDTSIPDTDGLLTNVPGVALLSCYADCVPLFFLDREKKVIGLSHAGWKGTVLKIGVETVEKMVKEFSCNKEDILVAIGPSIGPCHYEVDQSLIDRFAETFPYWTEFIEQTGEGKGRLNLWLANQMPLIEIGIPRENITISEQCTYCHDDEFFSYRSGNGKTGRMGSLMVLK